MYGRINSFIPYFTLIILNLSTDNVRSDTYETRDIGPGALDLIRARGFTGELYKIKSLDGYTLSVYHLINPLASEESLIQFPVIIFHGLGGDAAQMISRSENARPRRPVIGSIFLGQGDESLAFMLANNNYDVWLADSRGTNLNNHEVSDDLDPFRAHRFWNYSLDEQIFNDVPVQVDFVLKQTNSLKVIPIGYSESTLFMFGLLSTQPEFADKLAAFVALAPVAYVSHIRGSSASAIYLTLLIPDNFDVSSAPQPALDTAGFAMQKLCSLQLVRSTVCALASDSMAGPGKTSHDRNYFQNAVKSTSTKVIKHFLQLHIQDRFGMYDYGYRNMLKYGQPDPPNYDLGKIKLSTIIMVRGGRDFLSTPEDQLRLLRELGTKPYADIWLPEYNHLDVLLAKNIINDLNLPVLEKLQEIVQSTYRNVTRPQLQIRGNKQRPDVSVAPTVFATPDPSLVKTRTHLITNLLDGLGTDGSKTVSPIGQNTNELSGLLQNFERFGDNLINMVTDNIN